MHLTLKQETTRPAAANSLGQQARFDEGLAMKNPRRGLCPSPRPFPGLHGRRVVISTVFAGQRLGLREVENDVWLVSFMHYDLIDLDARTLQPVDTPFGSRASPM